MELFDVRNQTNTSADLYFYGDIVNSEWDRWEYEDAAPSTVLEFLEQVKGKDLNIYINSGGGSVFGGLAIYNMLKRHNGFKTVFVDGLAGSIASVIALAGDRVVVPENAFFMIHKPWANGAGDAEELRKLAADLDRVEESILNVYKEHMQEGVELNTIKEMVQAETWLSGAEAKNYFKIETGEQLEAVACSSDYIEHCKRTPKHLRNKQTEKQTKKEDINEIKEKNLLLELELL